MMRLICALLLLMSACSGEDKPPKGLLPEDKMADILADIHVAEARVGNLHLKSSDSSLLVYEKLEKDIWKRHRVDTLKYKESYAYYVSHPKIMVRIYEKVTSRLDTMEKRKRLNL